VNVGYIYLYSTDTRHSVRITQDHRETVQEILRRIRAMSVDSIPSLTQSQSKCEACSARTYCMPGARRLSSSPSDAEGTGWEGTTPGDLA